MVFGGFGDGAGFGGPGFGPGGFGGPGGPGFGPGCGPHGPGHGGPGFGFGPGGFGPGGFGPGHGGPRGPLKRVAFGTLALLLDGPADAAEIVARTGAATGGALTPPQPLVELAIGKLAGRGLVTVDDGVATLSELGRNVLAWRGVSSETAHAFLARAGQFGDVIKIRWGLFELAGLARKIFWSGTDEQKAALTAARADVLAAVEKATKSLHAALAK